MSQNTQILKHLKSGKTLTALQSLNLYGALRLASRIGELREAGYEIYTRMEKVGGKRIGVYKLDRN